MQDVHAALVEAPALADDDPVRQFKHTAVAVAPTLEEYVPGIHD